MKAANGGGLQAFPHFSYRQMLSGEAATKRPAEPERTGNEGVGDRSPSEATGDATSHKLGSIASAGAATPSGGGNGEAQDSWSKTGLGRHLPRTLLVHGTADTTVPFSQSTDVAAALKAAGVPTTTYFEPEGMSCRDHSAHPRG